MAIEATAHFINTDRRRFKKMTAKLWSELCALPSLEALYLDNIENVEIIFGKLDELKQPSELGFLNVEIPSDAERITLPPNITTLYLSHLHDDIGALINENKTIESLNLKEIDGSLSINVLGKLPNIKSLVVTNLFDSEYDYASLTSSLSKNCANISEVKISASEMTTTQIEAFVELAKTQSVSTHFEVDEDIIPLIEQVNENFQVAFTWEH